MSESKIDIQEQIDHLLRKAKRARQMDHLMDADQYQARADMLQQALNLKKEKSCKKKNS